MLNHDIAYNLMEIALEHSKAEQTEVLFLSKASSLTRLSNGGIHQHVASDNTEVRVRAVQGKRIGVASSNMLGIEDIRRVVDRALEIAQVSAPDPDFVSLPSETTAKVGTGTGVHVPASQGTPEPVPIFADQELLSPLRRTDAAAKMVEIAGSHGVTLSGHIAVSNSAIAVGNSLGVRSFHSYPESGVMAIMTKDSASGYADWAGPDLRSAPLEKLAEIASGKCLAGKNSIEMPPGKYTVVLEPPAVAEMLRMLAFIGLGATAYQEGRSFMSGNLGKHIVGENITLQDDTYHRGMFTLPFDFEGVPRQKVSFFDRGVASGVVYDSYTAGKEGKSSTGHALPAPNPVGPIPINLVLLPGTYDRENLIAGVENGILVTRFHYVNIVHPKETTLTGMTRDGTFFIKDGAISAAIKNLRFTQSVLDALRNVTAIERYLSLVHEDEISCLAPALRIEGFSFTS